MAARTLQFSGIITLRSSATVKCFMLSHFMLEEAAKLAGVAGLQRFHIKSGSSDGRKLSGKEAFRFSGM